MLKHHIQESRTRPPPCTLSLSQECTHRTTGALSIHVYQDLLECMLANKDQKQSGRGYRLDLDLEAVLPVRLERLSEELSAPAIKSAYDQNIRQAGFDLLEYM